jgi:alpha,alpha-trehalase
MTFKGQSALHRKDEETAKGLEAGQARQLYHDIASAAESGWDFSSRWMADGHSLSSLRTSSILPADLNAFLYKMETDLAQFAQVWLWVIRCVLIII